MKGVVVKRIFLSIGDFPLSPSDSSPNKLGERNELRAVYKFHAPSALLGELSEGLRGPALKLSSMHVAPNLLFQEVEKPGQNGQIDHHFKTSLLAFFHFGFSRPSQEG
jgi:hypothetical protein